MATQKYLVDLEVDGDVTADAFIKDGGTAAQFLKGDGSVDATTYSTTDTQLTTEQVQDIVGAMVSSNTEESISVTYTDGDGKLNFDATNEVSIGVSGAASGQVAIFSGGAQIEGYSSFTYDEANEDLTVGNNITAAAYINVPVIINCNFSHTSTNTSIWQNLPFNSLSENATAGEQHNWLAPKDGRIRKILFKNTSSGTAPSASRCAIRIQKNNSVVYTQSLTGVTGVGYGISHTLTLSDTNVLFSELDLIRIQFNSNGTMQDIAASTVIEFTE